MRRTVAFAFLVLSPTAHRVIRSPYDCEMNALRRGRGEARGGGGVRSRRIRPRCHCCRGTRVATQLQQQHARSKGRGRIYLVSDSKQKKNAHKTDIVFKKVTKQHLKKRMCCDKVCCEQPVSQGTVRECHVYPQLREPPAFPADNQAHSHYENQTWKSLERILVAVECVASRK